MKAKVLRVQEGTSDAGKSNLVTTICRWLARQSRRVAPDGAIEIARTVTAMTLLKHAFHEGARAMPAVER